MKICLPAFFPTNRPSLKLKEYEDNNYTCHDNGVGSTWTERLKLWDLNFPQMLIIFYTSCNYQLIITDASYVYYSYC